MSRSSDPSLNSNLLGRAPRSGLLLGRGFVFRYLFAFFVVSGAIALQWGVREFLSSAVFLMLYPSVFLVAWSAGFGPALLAIGASAASVIALFLAPAPGIIDPNLDDILRTLIFITLGTFISWVIARGTGIEAKARARLQESEARLALAHDASHSASFDMDLHDKTTPWSSELRSLYGITDPGFRGCYEDWLECVVPEDRPLVTQLIQRSLETGELRMEFRVRRHDTGEVRWLQSRGKVVRFGPHDPGRMVGVNIDITERKQAEEALRRSAQRLRGIFDHAGVGIIELETERDRIVAANDHLCKILDYRREELIGMTIHDLTAPSHRQLSKDMNEKARHGNHVEYEKQYLRHDGSAVWVHVTLSPVRDSAGRHLRSIVTVEDIGERKKTETALRRSLRQLNLATIFVRDLDDRITTWSSGCERYYGFTPAEALGKKAHELLKTEYPEPLAQAKRRLFETGHWSGELKQRRADGQEIFVASEWNLYRDANGAPSEIIASNNDITSRKHAEKRLELAIRAREEVMAVLSHDLRNPLSAVELAAGLLLRKCPQGCSTDFIVSRAEAIKRSTGRMLRLISDMLDISRLESGSFRVVPTPSNPKDIIGEALREMEPVATSKGIQLRAELDGPDEDVVCEHDRLAQVLFNLVGNAIKFSPEEKGVVRVSARPEGDEVLFSVTDNGPGISPEEQPRIFDRFWQSRDSRKAGSGLGLAIAQGIVSANGGRIWVDSQPGRGSTFFFSLPRARSAKGRALLLPKAG